MSIHTEALAFPDGAVCHLGIGEADVSAGSTVFQANLGSCLGIALGWPDNKVFGMAHVLLPTHPGGKDRRLTRYADSAVAYLIDAMKVPPKELRRVSAVIAGGSAMYDANSNVGQSNIASGKATLRKLRVWVMGEDVGGSVGRRLLLDSASGRVRSIRLSTETEMTEWTIRSRVRR